jgi:hypothetical protein
VAAHQAHLQLGEPVRRDGDLGQLAEAVVTPYTTAPDATMSSTTARVAAICARAPGASATGAPSSATRRSASTLRVLPSS